MTENVTRETASDRVKRTISRNVVVLIAGKLVYLVSRVALPPFILTYVGLEEYGIWACCFILITYLGMSAFGISNVYIRYVAEYHARQQSEQINRLLSTGLLVTGVLGAVVLVGLWFVLPLVVSAFKISPALYGTAFVLIFGTAATFVLDLSLGAFAYVLIGLQQIAAHTVIWVLTSCLEVALIFGLLLGGFGVYGLLIAFAARFVIATILYAVLCFRSLPDLSLRWRYVSRDVLRLFYGYGSIVQVAGLLSIFLYSIEKLIAGMFIGVKATALFDVGEKFPVMVSGIPSSVNAVFLPAVSQMHSLEQKEDTRKLYLKGARYISMLGGVLMAYLAAFAGPVIVAWLGPAADFQLAPFILAVFCLPFHMHVVTGPSSAIYRGIGRPARELIYPLTQLTLVVLTVGTSFVLVGRTVPVIAVAVGASMVTSALFYQACTNRFLGLEQRVYLRKVIVPGVLPYAIGFAVAAGLHPFVGDVTDRWHALAVLSLGGVAYAILVLPMMYRGLCDWGEREYLRKQLLQTLTGFVPRRWQPAWLVQQGATI